jgi:hypothetical protein
MTLSNLSPSHNSKEIETHNKREDYALQMHNKEFSANRMLLLQERAAGKLSSRSRVDRRATKPQIHGSPYADASRICVDKRTYIRTIPNTSANYVRTQPEVHTN